MNRRIKKILDTSVGETLIDAANLPNFSSGRLEGRMVAPLSRFTVVVVMFVIALIAILLVGRLWYIQIVQGEEYAEVMRNNYLIETKIFADRGVIFDAKGETIAWNETATSSEVAKRVYTKKLGMNQLLGFIKYPTKDKHGFYIRDDYEGVEGIEKAYQKILQGTAGAALTETDVHGSVVGSVVRAEPSHGTNISLTIDAGVNDALARSLIDVVETGGYQAGAGVIMDIHTGAILAMSSYPEFSSQILSDGVPTSTISEYSKDTKGRPFMNRVFQGAFTPGSVMKPIMAIGVMNEGIIDEREQIYSSGELRVQSPFDPTQYTIFRDRKELGWADMRRALAISSNIYFYTVGGGFGKQKGLGIDQMERYAKAFGLGSVTGIDIPGEISRPVPGIAWKAQVFPGEPWRLGDTYNTVIGQYGFQVTPLQMARAIAGIASKGTLVEPFLYASSTPVISKVPIDVSDHAYKVVHEGLRLTVTDGTAPAIKFDDVAIAAKTGTAEVGPRNTRINSWIVGFFPYDNPRYAFAVALENGPPESERSGTSVMRGVFQYMINSAKEYIE